MESRQSKNVSELNESGKQFAETLANQHLEEAEVLWNQAVEYRQLEDKRKREEELKIYERRSNAKRQWLLNNRLAQYPQWSTLEIAYLLPSEYGNKFLLETYSKVKEGRLGDKLLELFPQATSPRLWKAHERILDDLDIAATIQQGGVEPEYVARWVALQYLMERDMPKRIVPKELLAKGNPVESERYPTEGNNQKGGKGSVYLSATLGTGGAESLPETGEGARPVVRANFRGNGGGGILAFNKANYSSLRASLLATLKSEIMLLSEGDWHNKSTMQFLRFRDTGYFSELSEEFRKMGFGRCDLFAAEQSTEGNKIRFNYGFIDPSGTQWREAFELTRQNDAILSSNSETNKVAEKLVFVLKLWEGVLGPLDSFDAFCHTMNGHGCFIAPKKAESKSVRDQITLKALIEAVQDKFDIKRSTLRDKIAQAIKAGVIEKPYRKSHIPTMITFCNQNPPRRYDAFDR